MRELCGTGPDRVLRILRSRREGRAGSSKRRLALIIEGGGMRGVLSAGSLLALDLMGYRHSFDTVYAASAGAVNGAYFLSGQGRRGITIYFDDISNRRFFNPLRLTRILDVELVYDHVVTRHKPLDERAIRRAPTRLLVSVTRAASGRNERIDVRRTRHPIPSILKASSALPLLYNRTVALGGTAYVDGGLSDPLPVARAIADGHTDLLVLLTRTLDYRSRAPNLGKKMAFHLGMGRSFPRLTRAYGGVHRRSNQGRDLALGRETADGVSIATLCPTEEEMVVGTTTIARHRLLRGARLMAAKTLRAFGDRSVRLEDLFTRYSEPADPESDRPPGCPDEASTPHS